MAPLVITVHHIVLVDIYLSPSLGLIAFPLLPCRAVPAPTLALESKNEGRAVPDSYSLSNL